MPEPISRNIAQLIRQANEAASAGDVTEGQDIAQNAVLQATATHHKPTEAAAHYTFAVLLWQDEDASIKTAHHHASQAVKLATRHTDEYYLAATLLARIEAELGNFEAATRLLDELLATYRRKNRHAGIADNLRAQGDLAMKQNNYTLAHQHFAESLEIYRTMVNDPLNLGGLLLSLGSLCYREQNMSQARSYWREASELGGKEGLPQVARLASQNLSLIPQANNHDE